jgi:hypothetical protein
LWLGRKKLLRGYYCRKEAMVWWSIVHVYYKDRRGFALWSASPVVHTPCRLFGMWVISVVCPDYKGIDLGGMVLLGLRVIFGPFSRFGLTWDCLSLL